MPIVLYPASLGYAQGETGGPTAGSGVAVPGGIESTFEFNGLLLNQRRWWDTYIVTEIDGLDGADIRDERAANPADHGETAFDSFYGGKTIVLSGKIRAFSLSKMRDMTMALRAALADLQEHSLVIRSGNPATDVMIRCKNYQKPTIKEAQSDMTYRRDFQISLRAADPFIVSYLENYANVVMAASPASVTVTNRGDFEARPRLALIGPMTNPIITNATTGKTITMNGTLTPGQSWTIDVRKRIVTDQGGNNVYGKLAPTSDWMTLAPGDNSMQISATGITAGSSALQVFWNDTWM